MHNPGEVAEIVYGEKFTLQLMDKWCKRDTLEMHILEGVL